MSLRLVVTGANGFVGRHLIRRATARRAEVVGIVRTEAAAAAVANAGGRPVVVPALEASALAPVLAGASAVVHLAQIGAERPGVTYQAVNVEGTRAVVEAARFAGVTRMALFSGLGVAHYGQSRRSTNPYFLSKWAAELELLRSGLTPVVFRPSYIVGPGDALVPEFAQEIAAGIVELPGDGSYRMQPIAVEDAAAAILAGVERREAWPTVFDLVGPEPVSCAGFVERLGETLRGATRPHAYVLRSVPVEEADRRAAAGGYRGMSSDELDCMLCDEVADPRPLEALLGRFLTPLDEALAIAVRALPEV
ncbi:MAG: NAD-dependent epimerase/dehydratase family protein [Vicinamibacteria bacterium]